MSIAACVSVLHGMKCTWTETKKKFCNFLFSLQAERTRHFIHKNVHCVDYSAVGDFISDISAAQRNNEAMTAAITSSIDIPFTVNREQGTDVYVLSMKGASASSCYKDVGYRCRTQSQPKTTNHSIILVVHSNAIFHRLFGRKILLSAHLL